MCGVIRAPIGRASAKFESSGFLASGPSVKYRWYRIVSKYIAAMHRFQENKSVGGKTPLSLHMCSMSYRPRQNSNAFL